MCPNEFLNKKIEFLNKKITAKYINDMLKKYNCEFQISDITKYQQTFIHKSYHQTQINECDKNTSIDENIYNDNNIYSFDRLKFLGDSVIRLILTEYLFDRYDEDEGFLTKLRTKLENNMNLSKISHRLALNEYILIDNGIDNGIDNISKMDNVNDVKSLCDDDLSLNQKIYNKTNYKLVMGELIKSFMGILYLDSSFEICKQFFINVIECDIDIAEMLYYDINYKDKLLQYYHKMKWKDPSYDVVENANENHEKIYIVGAKNGIGDKLIGLGFGTTKLQAEQFSAKYALAYYNVDYECDNKISVNLNNDTHDLIPYILNPKNCCITCNNIYDIFKIYNCEITIKNINWYKQAMVHKSYTFDNFKKNKICKKFIITKNIQPTVNIIPSVKIQKKSYERLEFLGDSVIRLILSEYIYNRYSDQSEGFMTKLRTNIENGKILGSLAQKLNLNEFLIISKIEEMNNGRNGKIDILGDVFESFFGALYKDKNINACANFFIQIIEHEIDFASILFVDTNYKDQLLRIFHTKKYADPKYDLIDIKSNYNHVLFNNDMNNVTNLKNTKCFHVVLTNNDKIISEGYGCSKLMAEQNAAKNAIIYETYS